MKLKSFRDIDVKGKTVLLRSDLNSDIVKNKVLKGERIIESAKTIKALKKMGARIVILAHQGNPGKKDYLGLKQHAKHLGWGVSFVDDVVGEKAINAIKSLKNGQAILLDNVRSVEDEFLPKKKNNILIKNLLPLIDVYVNDAFSVAHREHTSIVGFARRVPSGIGLLFEKEMKAIERISMGSCLYILGGSKPEDNIKLLDKKRVITCGLFGQMCLVAKGMEFGYQDGFLQKTVSVKTRVGGERGAMSGYNALLKKLKKKLNGAHMPIDFAVDFEGKREEFALKDFPMSYEIEDIGEKTIEKYKTIIGRAKAIYMKGPVGLAEDKRFRKGTNEILKAVARCKGFSLVGGGQLSEAIKKSGISKKKFGHVSLSGGALLAVVAGEKLPGLRVLGWY